MRRKVGVGVGAMVLMVAFTPLLIMSVVFGVIAWEMFSSMQ